MAKKAKTTRKRRTGGKSQADPPKVAATRTEAAEILGIHPRTFSEWLSLGCPGVPATRWAAGEYDIAKIQAWRKANLNPDRNRKRDDDEDISTKEQIDRLKARKLEIEIAEKERRLIDVDEIHEIHMAVIVSPLLRLRDDFRGLPVENIVKDAIDEIIAVCRRLGT